MVVNHGGTLSKEYFKSYIQLMMNAKRCSLADAGEITTRQFFGMNKDRFGESTYKNFMKALSELKMD
ncbi:hypothetical protein KFZ56_01480 [Virgibacillus sp. NKC19-3]|uniref:hypothetical protein n=1 Tax=Virgibacillus saliphilus TaxID=2831674 RepID=UPI001C9A5DEE|nr:hypothetical protein [Virgibacillus sp. NKC19-3]MBY7141785.1 hypothetical protein [Virgibacillus sp. NKC19-3]